MEDKEESLSVFVYAFELQQDDPFSIFLQTFYVFIVLQASYLLCILQDFWHDFFAQQEDYSVCTLA